VSKAVAKEKNKHMKKYPAKIRKEDDTHVGSLAEARSVIGVMGLQVVREKHKIRHSWKLDEKSVCDIDFYDGLPPVVEIESLRSKDIYKWIKRLGLSSYRVTTRGSQKLFRYYASRLAS
jgi:adenylate cyclase class IV